MRVTILMRLLAITLVIAAWLAEKVGRLLPGPLPVHVPAKIDPADMVTDDNYGALYGCTAWRAWRLEQPEWPDQPKIS